MKMHTSLKLSPIYVLAAVVIAMGAVMAARGAAPALQGQLILRPLSPQDIKDYGLTNAQVASGLTVVGVGTPVHFEALVNYAVPNADITNVAWTLISKPLGSTAALEASPLGTNVPTFRVADRISNSGANTFKVGGRTMLRPDIRGQYTVRLVIQTALSGSTNVTQTITAGTYMGINTCALCHSGGLIASNMVVPWSQTLHATKFTRGINGQDSDHYSGNCISCHTVGYDTNTNAVNGGFDDIAKQLGWSFPTNLNSTNWDAVPAQLKNVANIQCENCHGPGSEHANALGDTNLIAVTFNVGNCAQCHDSKNNHVKVAEWNNSLHARPTRTPSGPGRQACARCHTAGGFEGFIEHASNYTTNNADTTYTAITCAACHDPHSVQNPHQLRTANNFTLPEGTTVTNAGLGAICMNCHHSRNGSAVDNIANYQKGLPTWAGGSSFGPHDSSAGDMIEGVNGIMYGKAIPSGAHSYSISNLCVGCHMQPVAVGDPAFTKAGGHTYSMTYSVITNSVTNVIDKVDVCIKCHGPITTFDMVRKDYNGDGIIEGIQTEVEHLLDKLSTLLPNSTYRADGNYVADGLVKSSLSVKTNWQTKFLNAAWNWQFVDVEGSRGIHNAPYALGLLKASIADLTGDGNNDGLPDSWQTQYFGSPNNPNAAPGANPAGDGIPNSVKYALGLDPTVPGTVVPDGVVWATGSAIGGSTNMIHIYTAAEVAFDTVVGRNYQIQAITSLGGSAWQNVGAPIPGTGKSVSYVTPMRNNVQQYYRVLQQ